MKKANYYRLIIFLVCMIGLAGTGFSQDSLFKKNQHIIGVEFQQTPITNPINNIANRAGYNLFYRLVLPTNTKLTTAITGSILYRRGSGFESSGGLGGSSSIYGDYEFVRLVVGIGPNIRLGKHKNFAICTGLNFGHIIYSNGNITKNDFSNGISTNTKGSTSEALSANYISLHLEISQAFKLTASYYLIIGLKQYLETPDFSGSKSNLTSSLFVACNIR